MCVSYVTVSRLDQFDLFDTPMDMSEPWPDEIYRDYLAPFIIHDANGKRKGKVGSYGMVPKRKLPPGKDFSTMNARDDTIGQLRTYKKAWAEGQLCLVPMTKFFEPNWEGPKHVRWAIGMADRMPFAVAGLYRQWDEEDGSVSYSFTQITINADEHTLMNRLHRPGEEKRSLVVVPMAEYDDWLACRDPERARAYLQPYPAELMFGEEAPKTAVTVQTSLF